jgi:hypothetical protein
MFRSNATTEVSDVPRWLQVVSGIAIGLVTLLCALGSFSLLFPPAEKHPISSVAGGIVALAACSWVMWKACRLVAGRPSTGGLISPVGLRVASVVILCLPVAGVFTGYFAEHPFAAPLQTLAYFWTFIFLQRLARHRAKVARDENESI